jgi:hypothetical protein
MRRKMEQVRKKEGGNTFKKKKNYCTAPKPKHSHPSKKNNTPQQKYEPFIDI